MADVGHTEVDGGTAVQLGEFLLCSSEADFQPFDFAEPALTLGLSGPDHPNTLATRANLANWQGEADDSAGAAAALAEMLADRLRVLGPDHPDTLTTQRDLVNWRNQALRTSD
ncbi:tetratricopeptide repeat protein [Streptomyces sp. NPDC087263]|uniref:tetratricopeptide repeat protein n=1 Tax=Streptomyces sp. NPDC087263 TaxID=3365773 RepID=UPI00381D8341